MTKLNHAHKLEDSLVTLSDKLSATVRALSDSQGDNDQYYGAIAIWTTEIRSVAEQAALANHSGLHHACLKIANQFQGLLNASTDKIRKYCFEVVSWAKSALEYLKNPDDLEIIEELLRPIPSDEWDDVINYFDMARSQTKEETIDFDEQADLSLEELEIAEDDTPQVSKLEVVIENSIEVLIQELADAFNDNEIQSESAFNCFLACVGDIGLAAELVENEFITTLCGEMEQHLILESGSPSALSKQDGEQYARWLFSLLSFLSDPTDEQILDELTGIVQQEQLAPLLATIDKPVADDPDAFSENIDTNVNNTQMSVIIEQSHFQNQDREEDWSDFDEIEGELLGEDEYAASSESNDVNVSAILHILRDELSDLAIEMSELVEIITDNNQDIALQQEAIESYLSLINRLAETCEGLGLTGLQQVCSFVDLNMMAFTTEANPDSKSIEPLLGSWPKQALFYLEDPDDDQRCLALIECLQHNDWIKPLNDTGARQLLLDLSKEMTLPEIVNNEPSRQTSVMPEDIAIEIATDTNPDLIDAFFHESPMFATDLCQCIGNIVSGQNIADNISSAQRFAHTLKGSANLIGVKGVANITHHMEDILEFLQTHPKDAPRPLLASLHEAADCVESMLDALQGKDSIPDNALDILQNILDWANSIDTGSLGEFSSSVIQAAPAIQKIDTSEKTKEALPSVNTHSLTEESLTVPTRIVDNMFRMVGEISVVSSQVKTSMERLKTQGIELKNQERLVQQHQNELEDMVDVRRFSAVQRRSKEQSVEDFDSLEMDQYDELHGSVHGFIETVADSNEMIKMTFDQIRHLESLLLSQQRINSDIQQVVIDARMVPVNTVTARLQRAVRQTCRSTGKNAELQILGAELLLDSEMLDTLVTPIMHVLRNAVDHGIEPCDIREEAGKNPVGAITLEFSRSGNNISVNCLDDGAGLNYKNIRDTAIQKDILSENTNLSNADLAQLILLSGFSTRDNVTQVSGRGVGMDIVNTTIQGQGGTMNISDNTPYGCCVSLNLPINMVTSHSVLVRCDKELVAIPSNTLERAIPINAGQFKLSEGEIIFQEKDLSYQVIPLEKLLGGKSPDLLKVQENQVVLLTRADDDIVGVVVEKVISSVNLVIKGTGRYVPPLPGISGVSIIGDGNVVSVLDLQELIEEPTSITQLYNDNYQDLLTDTSEEIPTILIVDDSMSMRRTLSQLVQDAGYKVETARDGVEAMSMIRKHEPNLVLSDMEMPRMTGLELASQIRSNDHFGHLPMIMITSRSTKKHRAQAERAGVNEYITKPFSEDALLHAMTALM